MESNLGFAGSLKMKKISRVQHAPLTWQVKNVLRWAFLWNWLTWWGAKLFSKITGIITVTGRLGATLFRADGSIVDYSWVAYGLVTTAFVEFMVDQLQTETSEWGDFKYHDSGVGTTAAAIGDTDIETTDGESRVAGSQTEGATADIYKSVGTITYSSTKAITEHGLFSQSSGTTLMDRHVFSAINVVNTDQIEFTYQLTVNDGG